MLLIVLLPLIFAFFIPFINKRKEKIHTGYFVLAIPLVIFIYFARHLGTDFEPITQHFAWIPSLHISFDFYLDGLSLLFVLLISGIGSLVTLYSIFYLDKSERLGHFYIYLLMFMSAMLGVVLSDNVFVLYTFWELTSISSFLLIGYWHFNERSRYGALKSMLITVIGGLSMLGGFILLSNITGTTSIQGILSESEMILNHSYLPLIMGLLILGAFTKSAQFPFHIWLPDAMEAPTPVSAYLHSATMVKAGIYLVARMSPLFHGYDWFFIVVGGIGILTLCWASFLAIKQTDLKGILAFSTISQLGMIMTMLGIGTEVAVFAAMFHILNHATFKGSLFMIAGIIDHETGTRDIRKLGGLMTLLPISATLAFFGTFSMAGVPLPFLNGFYSKELFFESTLHGSEYSASFAMFIQHILPWLAVFGSIFTFIYSMYFVFGVFRGKAKIEQLPKKPHEAPIGMLISPIVLIIGVIVIGLFPTIVNSPLLAHAAYAVSGVHEEHHIAYWHGLDAKFLMSLAVVGIGTVLFMTKKKWETLYQKLPTRWTFNRLYDQFVTKIEPFSATITKGYMTGSLRLYTQLIVVAMFIVSIFTLVTSDGFAFLTADPSEIKISELLVAVMMVVAAIGTIVARNNVAAILILGVVGYGLSILFVIYRAPDLALTQLVIETITVALFLLCFYHLPKMKPKQDTVRTKLLNAAISIGFGTLLTLVAISSHSSKWFPSISEYFIETSHTLGGGDNVVNVILVDMRGLDTLFEITVLGIAALGIYSLIKIRRNKEVD
ncbi:Na+/H+ antiporter subunit A [Radiobacillus kanasensis]|uniref:Na+/H+ antiporter subunit A n=1 Tax=Radiobacillus kanasensis TaxID=2844358 RepID=UPI001E5120E9|nr:Na+/H+ antiporter subunit A [Radiobacillus kanasensis]UFT97849.1 Na+/H+ antiporter subunit A [Radiobacillus kanasensis]